MPHYLILNMTPPAAERRSVFSWVDLGHIEILLWDPPRPPEAHGFCPAPPTPWRIFRSVFWPQRARMSRIVGFPGRPSYWKTWTVSPSGSQTVARYLDCLRDGCLGGGVRYRAITFNCFHVAYHCLELAGVDPPPAPRQWVLFIPTLGTTSFQVSVMRGIEPSSMADGIGRAQPPGS
jgi:hypothetical protein